MTGILVFSFFWWEGSGGSCLLLLVLCLAVQRCKDSVDSRLMSVLCSESCAFQYCVL